MTFEVSEAVPRITGRRVEAGLPPLTELKVSVGAVVSGAERVHVAEPLLVAGNTLPAASMAEIDTLYATPVCSDEMSTELVATVVEMTGVPLPEAGVMVT